MKWNYERGCGRRIPVRKGNTFLFGEVQNTILKESLFMKNFEEMIFKKHCILAVAPMYHEKYASAIYTTLETGTFYSHQNVTKNMELYCLLNGSSLEGRKLASRKCFKDVKNPSIVISDPLAIVAFQVPSAINGDIIWIMDILGATIESLPNNQTEITLSNQVKFVTPLAAHLVEKRKDRALNLLQANAFVYSLRQQILNNIANSRRKPIQPK